MRFPRRTARSWRGAVTTLAARRERFHALVAAALDELPPEISRALDNVEIVIEDHAAAGDTLGLYHGVPQTERDGGYSGVLPDVITIYRAPIEARAHDDASLEAEVRTTVRHEIAHHFGISDERLREIDRY